MKKLILVSLAIGLFINCENERKNDPKERSLQKVQFGYTIQSLPPNLQSGEDKVPQNTRNGIPNQDRKTNVSLEDSNIISNEQPLSNDQVGVPKFLVVSLKSSEGNAVINKEKLPLYKTDENHYLTSEKELMTGDYTIEEYLVIDENDKVLYAIPREGSPYSQYVNDPLPTKFSIEQERYKVISPEVIPMHYYIDLEQSGYESLSFRIKDVITLAAVALDENMSQTNAHLQIRSNQREIVLEQDLEAKVQRIIFEMQKGENVFYFIVSKKGYYTFTETLSKSDLLAIVQDERLLFFRTKPDKGEEKVIKSSIIKIHNEKELTNFANEGYTIINGDLLLYGLTGVQDLKALNKLTAIKGSLCISDTDLSSLEGLEQLTSIKGGLLIDDNKKLVNLNGLNNITQLGKFHEYYDEKKEYLIGLRISNNEVLNDITGLGNITFIEGGLTIVNNPLLINLKGLEKLTSSGNTIIKDPLTGIFSANVLFLNTSVSHDDSFFCPLKNLIHKNPYYAIVIGSEILKSPAFEKKFLKNCK